MVCRAGILPIKPAQWLSLSENLRVLTGPNPSSLPTPGAKTPPDPAEPTYTIPGNPKNTPPSSQGCSGFGSGGGLNGGGGERGQWLSKIPSPTYVQDNVFYYRKNPNN